MMYDYHVFVEVAIKVFGEEVRASVREEIWLNPLDLSSEQNGAVKLNYLHGPSSRIAYANYR